MEQSCVNEPVLEMDSKDSCPDNSSTHSDRPSSFDASSALPLISESVSLNEHRRAILDLSISKIQTMNTSNVAVSLRKSLLIYNMMKSLQRDLNASDVYVCDSLIESENVMIDDVEMLEANEFEEGNWKQLTSDYNCNVNNDNNPCTQHFGYSWPWGTLVNTNKDPMQCGLKALLKMRKLQDLERCGSDNLFTLSNSNDLFSAGNIWSSSDSTDSAFVDDYLGMLCAWEDENYNPLTNCNLTRAEIMNMFRLPTYHLNNQLVSQA
ncbi:unnamed protein product [Litomosoides sigmodontis]|uniref:SERTA domain-containing protein n=1 Tax=Litomosoides sigmodontis TaxID=42156 RepID=A0A3P6TAR0_LITSI|nr:unnamed protein product [Litomosoides sigmodontis]